ncbi:MAG: hypothetical protein ACO1SV_00775 [Fimbriimonas sp.]
MGLRNVQNMTNGSSSGDRLGELRERKVAIETALKEIANARAARRPIGEATRIREDRLRKELANVYGQMGRMQRPSAPPASGGGMTPEEWERNLGQYAREYDKTRPGDPNADYDLQWYSNNGKGRLPHQRPKMKSGHEMYLDGYNKMSRHTLIQLGMMVDFGGIGKSMAGKVSKEGLEDFYATMGSLGVSLAGAGAGTVPQVLNMLGKVDTAHTLINAAVNSKDTKRQRAVTAGQEIAKTVGEYGSDHLINKLPWMLKR